MIIKNSRDAVMERMKTAMENINEDKLSDIDTASASAAGKHPETESEAGKEVEEGMESATASPDTAASDVTGESETTEETTETANESSANEPGESEKKGFRKRFKGDKKQDALKERVNELEDKVIRQMAEFENFRKRTEKEKSQMFETGVRSVIEKILPVVDNFERGLAAIPEGEKASPFAEGMNMIYKQLMNELENLGVKVIETVGKEFNPNLHNAVMQVESDEYEPGIIAQEMQKGYTYRDTVVRYSMVAVVN